MPPAKHSHCHQQAHSCIMQLHYATLFCGQPFTVSLHACKECTIPRVSCTPACANAWAFRRDGRMAHKSHASIFINIRDSKNLSTRLRGNLAALLLSVAAHALYRLNREEKERILERPHHPHPHRLRPICCAAVFSALSKAKTFCCMRCHAGHAQSMLPHLRLHMWRAVWSMGTIHHSCCGRFFRFIFLLLHAASFDSSAVAGAAQ
jgi:hypothetical protein